MWRDTSRCLLVLMVHWWSQGEGRQCGFPGRPKNGSSLTTANISRPGDTVHYSCLPRFTLFGEDERVCLDSGIWAGRQPLCELNLSLERNALVSSTLWNYRAALAVDGNPDTCTFTPRTTEQRWWQVDLNVDQNVGSVALIINKDSYQELTIFVIQLLSKSEALYKPCATFKGRFQNPRILFTCNKGLGHQGRYVYIRDDRKDQDYFGLCEVEVFAYRDETMCGDPEVPTAGHVSLSADGTAVYSCDTGYRLIAEPNRTCERDGHWAGHAPQCQEIQCEPPAKTSFGFPSVAHLKGKFPFDSRVTYKCQLGYFILGNATRVCTESGLWSGTVPQCKPITCGHPRTFPHSDVELLNMSALWNTMAVYSCKQGYSFAPGTTQVTIKCLETGNWEQLDISCVPNVKRNLPKKLTGNEYGQHPETEDSENVEETIGMSGIISIGIICSLLLIMLAVLGIFLAKRFQSKKTALRVAASKSSSNDLIVSSSTKDGIYDDINTAPSIVVKGQPQCPPPGITDSDANNYHTMPFFSRRQDPSQYDTLHSLPSASSYTANSLPEIMMTESSKPIILDGSQEEAYYSVSIPNQDKGYETIAIRSDSEYETIHSLQQLGIDLDSTYEIVMPGGVTGKTNHSQLSIPLALKLFLQSPTKQCIEESQMHDLNQVPSEILALYAQVDKSKKRNYNKNVSNNTDGYHKCDCYQQLSSTECNTQLQCSPPVPNGGHNNISKREGVDSFTVHCNGTTTLKN